MARISLMTVGNVREFFIGAVRAAAENQHAQVSDAAVVYVAGALSLFADAGACGSEEWLRPLAQWYADAAAAPTAAIRRHALRCLGDEALIVAGLFDRHFDRKPVDVDYCVSMGMAAYGVLVGGANQGPGSVFSELSLRFCELVGLLNEIGAHRHMKDMADPVRMFDLWSKTGSRHYARRLADAGIALVGAPAMN